MDEREAEDAGRRQREAAADEAIKAKHEAERLGALNWTIEDARWEYNLQFHRGPNLGWTVEQIVNAIFAERVRLALRPDPDTNR